MFLQATELTESKSLVIKTNQFFKGYDKKLKTIIVLQNFKALILSVD